MTEWLKDIRMSHELNVKEREAVNAIRQIGTNAIPFLLRLLKAHDSQLKLKVQAEPLGGLKIWTAIMLAKTGQYRELVLPQLLSGLTFPENDTRAQSVKSLLNYPGAAEEHIAEIRKLAEDRDTIARNGARHVLRIIDPESADRMGTEHGDLAMRRQTAMSNKSLDARRIQESRERSAGSLPARSSENLLKTAAGRPPALLDESAVMLDARRTPKPQP